MYNDYMYAVDRSDEYLAHYGIKGMKWGVRKAIESGNSRKLARQYKKAQKKLAKLEKRAANGQKYARRAAALGAGAALAGGAAVAGTGGISNAMKGVAGLAGRASTAIGAGATKLGGAMAARGIRGGGKVKALGQGLQSVGLGGAGALARAGHAVDKWGNATHDVEKSIHGGLARVGLGSQGNAIHKAMEKSREEGRSAIRKALSTTTDPENVRMLNQHYANLGKAPTVSNNALARVGAGALGAGLAAGAAYNAYRAATTKKAAQKAQQFRSEMNKAFAGTQYANGGKGQSGGSKKRRRR